MLPPPLTPFRLAEKRKWYEARGKFLGQLDTVDFAEGLRLAKLSTEDEAKWLCDVFPVAPSNIDDVIKVFLDTAAQSNIKASTKARCLAYASCLQDDENTSLRAANLGDSFAQAYVSDYYFAERGDDVNQFLYAERSALQYDPAGMTALATLFFEGIGCIKQPEKAEFYYKFAASLGSVSASYEYGQILLVKDTTNLEAYIFLGKAWKVSHVIFNQFRYAAEDVMLQVKAGLPKENLAPILFCIGEILCVKPLRNENPNAIRRNRRCVDRNACVMIAAEMYKEWCRKARLAVDTWSLIAKRLGVHKDIRILIGKMVWDMKSDADYVLSDGTLEKLRRLP